MGSALACTREESFIFKERLIMAFSACTCAIKFFSGIVRCISKEGFAVHECIANLASKKYSEIYCCEPVGTVRVGEGLPLTLYM